MSLNFPISLSGKKGGVDLKEGLVDWWDGGSTIGQFAGNNIGSFGNTVSNQPSTFSKAYKWSNNKNSFFGTLGCSFNTGGGKQTIGVIIRKPAYAVNTYVIQAGGSGSCRLSYNNDGNRVNTSYYNMSGKNRYLGTNQWILILYQWDADTKEGQTFFNDDFEGNLPLANKGNGPIYRIGNPAVDVAQIIYWKRWMTQEDADLLYNGGAYTRYTDLPHFQELPGETYTYRSDGTIHERTVASVPYAWLPNNLDVYSIKFGTNTTTTGNRAFKNCENLVNVEIPEHITLIDEYSFESCSALRRVEIPRLTALPAGGGNPFHQSGAAKIHLPVNHPTTATTAYNRTIIKDLPAL